MSNAAFINILPHLSSHFLPPVCELEHSSLYAPARNSPLGGLVNLKKHHYGSSIQGVRSNGPTIQNILSVVNIEFYELIKT